MIWLILIAGWLALSGELVFLSYSLLLSLQFVMGMAAVLIHIGATRLAMVIVPEMGRSHFFAIYSVATSLTLGLAPMIWGVVIDLCARLQVQWGGFLWTRFGVFFAGVLLVFFIALLLCFQLEERQAASLDTILRRILTRSSRRFWFRLWPRG